MRRALQRAVQAAALGGRRLGRGFASEASDPEQQPKGIPKIVKQVVGRLAFVGTLVTVDFAYNSYAEERRKRAILLALDRGSYKRSTPLYEYPRQQDVDRMKNWLEAADTVSYYYVITGEPGVGKTTLVSMACRELESGVLYVAVPNDIVDFGKAFGNAIGFHFDERISFTEAFRRRLLDIPLNDPPQGAEPLASVRRVLPVLKAAAKKFRDKHGRPPVLIIDNMDRLVNEEPKVAELLQDFAQDCADASSLLLVFIVNSGEPLAMLRARSSWSRADQPPIEVEDLSDSQAVDYMVRRGVDPNIAREAVTNICGGRFVILNRVCEQLLHKMPLEDVKRQQLINARFEYHRAGLLTQGPVRQYGWRLAEALLNAPGNYLLSAEFDALVPDAAIQKHLLDQSVFTFRQSVDTVAFKNRPVLVYARDHLKAMQK